MALAAMAGGMAWAALPAWLRVRWNASEILTSLMLSYVAGLLLVWAVHGPLRDPDGFGFPESRLFGARALVPVLVAGTRLHLGAVLALAAALAGWLVLSRSLAGFRLKVQGLAPAAAHYAGFGGAGAVWTGFLAGGALSGLAGMLEVAGPIGQLTPSISPGYGFTAIIAAFLGRLHPLGIVAAALMLALSFLGGEAARIGLGLPQAITQVFQGLLLFYLLAADLLVRWRLRWGPP
jgi:simple sugar transport system permease protein